MLPHSLLRGSIILFIAALAAAQTSPPTATPAPTPTPSLTPTPATTNPYEQKRLSEAELAQIVAPIALYPDPLVSQILMASTYPLEIVQADRWRKEHKDLTGDALAKALEQQPWDPSVKSLINFPDVLSAMSEKLDLTIKLGDAFVAQQQDVMAVIQMLRAKAEASGALKSNEHQTVTTEAAPAGAPTTIVEQPAAQVISIQPAQPNTIYVPSYSPTVVYGGWPYPSYPPAYYYPPPPAPAYGANLVSFGLGVACGAAWGYAWGNCNWNGGDVDIDVDRNTEFNRNINRESYRNEFNNRQTARGNTGAGARGGTARNSWQHNPSHRGGVPYADARSNQRFNNSQSARAVQARESYRGRADTGRQQIGASNYQNRARTAGYTTPGAGARSSPAARSSAAARSNSAARASSPYAGTRSNSFSGVDRGGASARAASSRGQASRSYSSAGRSAGARGGGGGGRRGGGGGRGGRR